MSLLLENRRKLLLNSPSVSSPSTPVSPRELWRRGTELTLNSISELAKKADDTVRGNTTPLSPEIDGYGNAKSETPLHVAATCGHDAVVDALISAGEDYNAKTEGGWTPLHNAVWFGHLSVVKRLIEAGADNLAITKEQLTALHCAVKNNQPAMVEMLLQQPGIPIEAQDQYGLTAFHMACKCDNVTIMEILLDYGASIEARMRQGWTPLIWACVYGRFKVAQTLLKRGADLGARWVHHAGRALELGPLALARAYHHEAIEHLLKNFGAVDTTTMTTSEEESLPSSVNVVESYATPDATANSDIDVSQAFTEVELVHSVSDNDTPGEDDSDDDSEDSEDEDRLRKRAPSGHTADLPPQDRAGTVGRGLGIDPYGAESSLGTKEAVAQTTEHVQPSNSMPQDQAFAAGTPPRIPSTSLLPSETTTSTNSNGSAREDHALAKLTAWGRSSSVSAISGAVNGSLRKMIPKMGERSMSEPMQSAPRDTAVESGETQPSSIAADDGFTREVPADGDIAQNEAAKVSRFSRIPGAKRMLSWKSDDQRSSMTTSPTIHEHDEPFLVDSRVQQLDVSSPSSLDATDDTGLVAGPDPVSKNETPSADGGRSSRFARPKRILSWKSEA